MCVSVTALIASVILVLKSPQKLGFHEKTTVLTYLHRKKYNEDKSGEHAGLALGPPLPTNLGKFHSKTAQHQQQIGKAHHHAEN